MLHPNQLRQVSPLHRAVDGSEPEPCCLGAAVHTVIWLLTSSTFCQTALTAIPLHEGAHLSGEISISVLVAKPAFSQTLFLIFCTQQCQPSLQAAFNPKIIFRQSKANALTYIYF